MALSVEDRVVRTVDAQTTPMQPDTVRPVTIVATLAASGSLNHDDVRGAITDAVEAGRLEHTDDDRLRIPEDVDVPSRAGAAR